MSLRWTGFSPALLLRPPARAPPGLGQEPDGISSRGSRKASKGRRGASGPGAGNLGPSPASANLNFLSSVSFFLSLLCPPQLTGVMASSKLRDPADEVFGKFCVVLSVAVDTAIEQSFQDPGP